MARLIVPPSARHLIVPPAPGKKTPPAPRVRRYAGKADIDRALIEQILTDQVKKKITHRILRELKRDPRIKRILEGSQQTFIETIVAQDAAGSAFATFTTAKTVIPATSLFQFPPNFWYQPGRVMRIRVCGSLSTLVTTPGTVVFQVMFGTIAVFTTGTIQLNATAHTTLPFTLDILMTLRAKGSGTSANFIGQSVLTGVMFTKTAAQTDGANTETVINAPVTAPAVGTGFDSTISNTLDFFTGFSISSGSNQVQIQQYIAEILN